MKRPTAQRGAETRLQRRHRELLSGLALQRSTRALALFRDGHLVLANPRWHAWSGARSAVLGWSVGHGARLRRYIDLATLGATELPKSKRAKAVTLLAERRDGKQVLRLHLERVAPEGEEPLGLLVADDITEETARAAEMAGLRERAKKREQMDALGRMAAGLAHDLGNTLNALALRIQRLARTAPRADSTQLAAIDETIEVMRLTLDRLDRFSGRRSRPLEPVMLRRVVDAAVATAGPLIGSDAAGAASPIELEIALPRRLPRVLADAAELTNVLVNLLINARDAMPEGGRVRIDATVGKHAVSLHVSDEGTGFRPEPMARVFEPFFTTKGARGSGLGLSLAYGFMQAIGGSIRVANREGGGAELVLELPIARA
jgi:signal transduction histidine kinase